MEGSVENVVLFCEGCGERMVLGAPRSVWLSGRTLFECGCGARLTTLSDRLKPAGANEATEVAAALRS